MKHPETPEQMCMASDLQSALGYAPAAGPDPKFADESWADWWAALCEEVREMRRERDARDLLDGGVA